MKSSQIFYLIFPPVRVSGVVEPRTHELFSSHFSAIFEGDLDVFVMSMEKGKFWVRPDTPTCFGRQGARWTCGNARSRYKHALCSLESMLCCCLWTLMSMYMDGVIPMRYTDETSWIRCQLKSVQISSSFHFNLAQDASLRTVLRLLSSGPLWDATLGTTPTWENLLP